MTPSPSHHAAAQPGPEPRRGAGGARPAGRGDPGPQGTGRVRDNDNLSAPCSQPAEPLPALRCLRGARSGSAPGHPQRRPRALRSGPGMLRNAKPSSEPSPMGKNPSRKASRLAGAGPDPSRKPCPWRGAGGLGCPRRPRAAPGLGSASAPGPGCAVPRARADLGPAGLRPRVNQRLPVNKCPEAAAAGPPYLKTHGNTDLPENTDFSLLQHGTLWRFASVPPGINYARCNPACW